MSLQRIFPALFLVLLLNQGMTAQKRNHFSVTTGMGAIFLLNDPSPHRQSGYMASGGINYNLRPKSRVFQFNPGLSFQYHEYLTHFSYKRRAHLSQHMLSLSTDILLQLSKHSLLRAGLFWNLLFMSEHTISQRQAGQTSYFSNDELSKGYSGSAFQTGFTVGLSFPFILVRREIRFNIKAVHQVSSVVEKDYTIDQALIGEHVRVMSAKTRPLIISLGFDFSLVRLKKKEPREED
jgi:hypothetical protein